MLSQIQRAAILELNTQKVMIRVSTRPTRSAVATQRSGKISGSTPNQLSRPRNAGNEL